MQEFVHADEGDALNFSVGQSIRYESNLFRIGDGERAPGNRAHDTVSETGLGLKFDRRYGRQRLLADLNFVSARYAIHNDLDHDRPEVRLGWDWQLGDRWSGDLSHEHRESLPGFDERSGTERSLNTYTRTHASADFWWHPRWAVGAGVAHTRSRFDGDDANLAAYDADTVDVNLTYRPPTGNRVVLTLRDTDGEYLNRPAVAGSIRDYRQQEVRLAGEWQLSGATRVSGFIGQSRVDYRLAPERDFRGAIGRVGFVWDATAKTSLDVSVRREIGAQQDLAANYAVTDALRVAPRWNVTDKVSLGAGLEWRRRDYRGERELAGAGVTRERPDDRSYRYGLHAEYRPLRALSFGLSVQRQVRDGSRSLDGYTADIADVSMQFRF
ncbi:outer membrane beta-barrel protein [Aromatoleum toluvorans]|uniref:Outer membrane beta-barrel protein n=1 Tax=Aromatoleum toluvorans TaxID=92002 RepID=A0ABX1Q412_9RHOO|nr:XrtB/PEP-CTERM-associated polysaccharide biosynthesis outer membrane protein EpsL [Aromatoleum toluvorans]NMG46103.1 outer membrane beta-barrel protein [Aromatoleum toluvorans]